MCAPSSRNEFGSDGLIHTLIEILTIPENLLRIGGDISTHQLVQLTKHGVGEDSLRVGTNIKIS